MTVYVLMEDYGPHDGGATIIEIHVNEAEAERRAAEENAKGYFPNYHVEKHSVQKQPMEYVI